MKEVRLIYFGFGKSNTYGALKKYLYHTNPDIREVIPCRLFEDDEYQIHLLPGKNMDEIKEALLFHEADYAFVPFANDDCGLVPQVRDLLLNKEVPLELFDTYKAKIVLYSYIHKNNKGISGYDIQSVYGNIPTLRECSLFLNEYLPFAAMRKKASTTESLQYLMDHPDEKALAFGNASISDYPDLIPFREESASNLGATWTRFFLVGRRKKMLKEELKGENIIEEIKEKLCGYYLYLSKPSPHSLVSKTPASYRIVKIVKEGKDLSLYGRTIGYSDSPLCHSVSSTIDIKDNVLYFYYEYEPDKANNASVKGLVLLKTDVDDFLSKHVLSGNYYGYDNNKSGTIRFIKISTEEYKRYMKDE